MVHGLEADALVADEHASLVAVGERTQPLEIARGHRLAAVRHGEEPLGSNDDDSGITNTADESLVVGVLEQLNQKSVVVVLPN
jgi:hypothetical protein